MAQKAKNIIADSAKVRKETPLAPEAKVGVAVGTVADVVEVDLMIEDEVVPKMNEIDEASVLVDVITRVLPVILGVLVAAVNVVVPMTAGTDGVAVKLKVPETGGIVWVLMTIEAMDEEMLAKPVVTPTGRRGLQKSGMTVTVLVTVSTVMMKDALAAEILRWKEGSPYPDERPEPQGQR
ncbi:MAG: hypothetical protein Q9187_008394 [Circinaria calcarea]